MNRGYIKLYRKIFNNDLYLFSEEKFCKRAAWIDLLLLANHKEGCVFEGMCKRTIRRGQLKTSEVKLAERWHWNIKTVDKYLEMLQTEGMIYLEKYNMGSMITIVNYGKYQDFTPGHGYQNGEQNGYQNGDQWDNDMENNMDIGMGTNNKSMNDLISFNNGLKNKKKPLGRPGRPGFVYEE